VRVRGRNGIFDINDPFLLELILTTGNCSAVSSAVLPTSTHVPTSGPGIGFNTLILIDSVRMQGNAADLAALDDRLQSFIGRNEISVVVVDVNSDLRVQMANIQADAHPACPFAKNLVAYAIKDIIDGYRAMNPIEYIVILGNDATIPFFRHPDQAMLANERNYVVPVRDNTSSQASLKLGYILSQDRYGASVEISSRSDTLPIPEIPVGRLVETVADMVIQFDAYLATANGVVVPGSALTTGYDFLEDAANAVTNELSAGIGPNVTTLITQRHVSPTDPASWTADDLRNKLLTTRYDIGFLAGHFSASSTLAADYNTRLLASELATSPVDMSNAIFFSAGCHSGYNIVNEHGVPGVTAEPDWAQAFARKGAILIAGTGYQYGDTDFIEYSERLYFEFSQNLREGTGPVSIGQAFVAAKQQYLAETSELRPLHEKSILIATIFGLPMLSVDMPLGRFTPTADSSIVTETMGYATDPGNELGLNFADVSITPSLTTNTVPLDVLGGENTTVDATYLSGADGVVVNPAEPMLPLELRNVSVENMVLRGVGFRGGVFSDTGGVLPLTGAATTEIRGVHPPFVSDTFYPVMPWQVNYYDALMGGDIRLATFPAQYKSDGAISLTGTLRQYSGMDFRLFYSNFTQQYETSGNAPALAAAPTISNIVAEVNDGIVTFNVRVVGDPAAGIQEVWVTFTGDDDYENVWQSVDLMQDANDTTLWQGTLALNDATDILYIVQAVNGVGLVTAVTNLGNYYRITADGVPVPPVPDPTEISLQSPPTSGAYSTLTTVNALLTSNGVPLANQPVIFGLGAQKRVGVTNENGMATATLALLGLPGKVTLQATFGGDDFYLPSFDSTAFTITKQTTNLTLTPDPAVAGVDEDSGMYATLKDAAQRPFNEKTVFFTVVGDNGSYAAAAITNFNGRAFLGVVPLPPGTYQVMASFGNVVTFDSQSLDLTDVRFQGSIAIGTLEIKDEPIIYISPSTHSTVDDVVFRNEDILAYNTATDTWTMFFDGSDVGLFTANVGGFAMLEDNTLLISIDRKMNLAGIGQVTRNDILRFIPTELGENTAGSFEMFLDGSDVGLNSAAETIDAIGFIPDGRLFISTHRSFNINSFTGKGEDLIVFNAFSFGENTVGTWELYFDGSDVGLGNQSLENIWGAWIDPASGDIYLTTEGAFYVSPESNGSGSDIFICAPDSLGNDTSCTFSFFWLGAAHRLNHIILDALWIE
jgi:hypothetical protein